MEKRVAEKQSNKKTNASLLREKRYGWCSNKYGIFGISDIKSTVFPTGAPRDSMLDVHNTKLFPCGQIAVVSLANGGPVTNLFH